MIVTIYQQQSGMTLASGSVVKYSTAMRIEQFVYLVHELAQAHIEEGRPLSQKGIQP